VSLVIERNRETTKDTKVHEENVAKANRAFFTIDSNVFSQHEAALLSSFSKDDGVRQPIRRGLNGDFSGGSRERIGLHSRSASGANHGIDVGKAASCTPVRKRDAATGNGIAVLITYENAKRLW